MFVGLLLWSGYLCNYYCTGWIQLLYSAALFRLWSFTENITLMMLITRLPLQSVGETNLAREWFRPKSLRSLSEGIVPLLQISQNIKGLAHVRLELTFVHKLCKRDALGVEGPQRQLVWAALFGNLCGIHFSEGNLESLSRNHNYFLITIYIINTTSRPSQVSISAGEH